MTSAQIIAKTSTIGLTDAQQLELIQTFATDAANYTTVSSLTALSTSETTAAGTTLGLGTAFQGLKFKIKETAIAMGEFLLANPFGWVVLGVASIASITFQIVQFQKKLEEHRQKIKEAGETARSEIDSLKSDLDNLTSSADKALASYTKLMNKVSTFNNTNLSLSDEEYAEFINASNELADLFPELVIGLDKEGNRILDLGTNAEEASDKINALIDTKRKLVAEETETNLTAVFKGAFEDTREASKELEEYKRNLESFDHINGFIADLQGDAGQAGGKNISLSNSYLNGLDSETLMNYVAKVINDELGTDLEVKYNELTYQWHLDLTGIDESKYNEAIQALYLNSGLLKDKIVELMEPAIADARDEINKSYRQELSSIFTALSDDIDYISLSDTERQLADALISGLDYSEYRDEIKAKYKGDITKFLNEEILDGLYNASEEDKENINRIYAELLAIDPNASLIQNTKAIEQYVGDLAEILEMDSDKLKIILGYEFIDEDTERMNQAKIKATGSDTIDARSVASGSAQIQHAIEELNRKDLTLFLEADIPEGTRFTALDEFNEFMDSLRAKAKVDIGVETDLSSYLTRHQDLEDTLIQLSQTGRLDAAAIQSLEEYDDMLKLCGDDADTLIERINEIASQSVTSFHAANNLSTITGGLDSLAEVYNQTMENDFVTSDAITSLYDQFGDLSVFDDFVTTMQNIGDEAYNTADAFNDLADAYINACLPMDNLTEATKNQYIAELEGNGITNARTAIEERLAYMEGIREQALASLASTQQYANATTQALANATLDEISNMITAANAAGADTSALGYLAAAKVKSNSNQINESTTVNELITAAKAAGVGATAIEAYNVTKNYIHGKDLETYTNTIKNSLIRELTSFDIGFTPYTYSGAGKYSSSGGSSSASQAKDATRQYNWIETAINRVTEAIARLTKVRDNTYTDWSKRNAALNSEIARTTEEIDLQQQAYNSYMAKANRIGLSQDYINKLQNGAIQIEDITDEGLQDNIDQYQEWYDKAVDCSDAIADLNLDLSELAQKKFDNIQTEFDSLIATITAQADVIDKRISRTEEQGYFADRQYYEQLMTYENQTLTDLSKEYAALQTSLKEAVNAGRIEEGSEAWHKMNAELLDVEQSMEESTTALVRFHNEMRNLSWDVFDYITDRISQITRESDFLIDLLDKGSLYDDTGAFNSEGKAAAALHGVNYNTYMQQSLDYAKELRQIETDLAKDPGNKDLIERREELLKLQQEAIVNAEAEKNEIQSLVKGGMELHLDALSELIDKYREGLHAARDLYDYQKNISRQTTSIANLEKIILAYQGDDSEEARKFIQDTKNQLADARQELQETQWDRYISETEDLLDALYSEYETILNQRLDNIDALIGDIIDMVNVSGSEIRESMETTASKAGYAITNTLNSIFGNGGSQTSLISKFMSRFDTASTNLQNAINDIKNSIHGRMATSAVAEASGGTSNNGTGATGSMANTSKTSISTVGTSQAPSSPQGDGVAGVGDMVTFINGRYHEDSWGNGRSGAQNLNGPVYITRIKAGSPYPYHISRGPGLGNGDLGWVTLDQLRGYRTGAKRIHGDQWAFTQEEGTELIRTSDGAILTRLGDGDTVFTSEMTRNLWALSKGKLPVSGLAIHTMAHTPDINGNSRVVNNRNDITITLPNVTNYTEFKQELQKDNRFIGFVQEVTSGLALGKPKLNRRKY